MGQEIRRVPADWNHPKTKGIYKPLVDDYVDYLKYYKENVEQFIKHMTEIVETGKSTLYDTKYTDSKELYEYLTDEDQMNPPNINDFMPNGDWYQLYENVSEGTPLSPAFEKPEELVEWLTNNKDFWNHQWTPEQAEAIVDKGYAMSGVMTGGKFYTAEESTLDMSHNKHTQVSDMANSSPEDSNGHLKSASNRGEDDRRVELEAILEDFGYSIVNNPDKSRIELSKTAVDKLAALLARAERAYGGCHNCYGKGYATVNEYISGGGHKWKVDNIKPCTCDRGKQFAAVKRQAEREGQKKVLLGIKDGIMEVPEAIDLPGTKTTLRIIDKLLERISSLEQPLGGLETPSETAEPKDTKSITGESA